MLPRPPQTSRSRALHTCIAGMFCVSIAALVVLVATHQHELTSGCVSPSPRTGCTPRTGCKSMQSLLATHPPDAFDYPLSRHRVNTLGGCHNGSWSQEQHSRLMGKRSQCNCSGTFTQTLETHQSPWAPTPEILLNAHISTSTEYPGVICCWLCQ